MAGRRLRVALVRREAMDWLSTRRKWGKKATRSDKVSNTWKGVLTGSGEHTEVGVLVGKPGEAGGVG